MLAPLHTRTDVCRVQEPSSGLPPVRRLYQRVRSSAEEQALSSAHLAAMRSVAYHLLQHGEADPERMTTEIDSVLRARPRAIHLGHPVDVSLSAGAIPLGLWYRRDAAALVDVVGRLGSLQLATPETIAAALTVGGAVAAWTYGQRHLDVWHAVIETVRMHEHARESELGRAIHDGWHAFDRDGHVSLLSAAPIRAVLHTAKLGDARRQGGRRRGGAGRLYRQRTFRILRWCHGRGAPRDSGLELAGSRGGLVHRDGAALDGEPSRDAGSHRPCATAKPDDRQKVTATEINSSRPRSPAVA